MFCATISKRFKLTPFTDTSYYLAPRPPFRSPSPVSKLDRRHRKTEKERQFADGKRGLGGGRWAESYDREKAWSSTNHQYRRVGRVLSLFSSRRNWDPSPAGECAPLPPPPRFWREGHTRWRERGWDSLNSDEGTYIVVLFIYTYFVINILSGLIHFLFYYKSNITRK